MTLLISDSYRASVFLLAFLLYTLVFFIFLSAPQLTYFYFFLPSTVQKRSGVDPCRPFCGLHFLTITAGPSPVKCNGPACLPDCVQRWPIDGHHSYCPLLFLSTRGMFAADVHACRLLPSLPDQGFEDYPLGDGLSIAGCSKWSELLSTKSITSFFRHLVAYVLRAVPCWSQWGKKINERKKN